jgi:hypothetical protein
VVYVARPRENINTYNYLVRQSERMRPHRRPRHRYNANVTVILKKSDGRLWAELLRLRMGTGGGLYWT